MLVLAFDTAGLELSVALLKEKKLLAKNTINEIGKQSELLIPEIEKILREQKIWYQDLDLIVTTKGPGSFTGTRIGLTVARIIKASTNLPLILINSDEVKNIEINSIALLGLERFCGGENSKDLNPIYSQGPRISERKK
ncbi:MAG: tRNA (adenosine(37)-N6)-threonylcarbamoyltransferase complex dimerization subunit type 1 TsaB [Proteobacteria bacterium]|nr:tRNA (adenosine(37)-N6)-threonylcarbamoyltransferase complex dimerization subunit type 1 TsaB [Pseudomonadota bacterium]